MLTRIYKIRNLLLLAALASSFLTACGSEGDYVNTPMAETEIMTQKNSNEGHANYLIVSGEDYDLLTPNFYYSTDSEAFWSIQANIAEDVHDIDALNVIRIDVPKENGLMPTNLDKTFSIEDSLEFEKFPGEILVFNGKLSTYNRVEEGVISFFKSEDTASGYVGGVFQVVLTGYDAPVTPAPQHILTGFFGFEMGTYGSVISTPTDYSEDNEEIELAFRVDGDLAPLEGE